ncbi:MAG: helix-turn-helix transcriptional regulator [Anaerolineales bacterium]|nr:helix-turn-helix transcriptional regulator [Anaerolineales bacterium]
MNEIRIKIRAKKLGILVHDARRAARKGLADCAQLLGIPEALFEAYEFGDASPSMPELELLSDYLDVPLEHFWEDRTLESPQSEGEQMDAAQFVALRQRIIGALLQKLRLDKALTLQDVAERAGVPTDRLEGYEFGEAAVPVPELEALCAALETPVTEFQDQTGPLGVKISQRRSLQEYLALPPELRAFISKPVNRPYLELAQRLSEMSVEKLRTVAEGLLEITL